MNIQKEKKEKSVEEIPNNDCNAFLDFIIKQEKYKKRMVNLNKVIDELWELIEKLKDKKFQKEMQVNFPYSIIQELCDILGCLPGDRYLEYSKKCFQYYLELKQLKEAV